MPVVPAAGGGGGSPRVRGDSGFVAVLRHALDALQERVELDYGRLRGRGTCSREFMEWLEELERLADRELVYRGFEKLEGFPPARRGEASGDLPVAYYRVGDAVVEIGLSRLNRCGVLEALTGGEPPRVYARVYLAGRAAFVLEASRGSAAAGRGRHVGYYIM